MKKRIELILCALIFCSGCFVGCSSISKGTYADEAFMKSLASGLEARWKLAEEQEAKLEENREVESGSEEQIEEYAAYVEAELNAVSKYQDEKFADDRLQEQACSYIDCLNNQKEALQYASVDLQKYYAMWYSAYNERSKLLETFVNDYGLKVAEEHQDTLADLLDYAGKVKEFEVQQKEIEAFLSTIQFELIGVNGAWKTYSAVVENTTSVDFTYLTLCASLLNADGTIDDVAQDSVSNFKRGDVATFAFSTDKEFSAIEMQANEPTDHGIFKGAYVDQAFIKSLASGLEVRWERWDEEIKKGIDLTVTSDSYINTNIACIQAELDEILKYQDETFSDHVLKEKMCSYIDCLYGLEEALQYPKVDLQKYYNLWYNAYYERSKLIESFVNNYGLEVTETYQEELDDQVECGRLMREFAYQQNEEEIKGFLSSIQFALTNINGEWKTYTAVVENTTDVDFRFIDIDITLLDADDTVMGTSYDGVSNVRSGDVVTFAFSTNQEFLKLETQVSGSVG